MEWKEEFTQILEDFTNKEKQSIKNKQDRLLWLSSLEIDNCFELKLLPLECRSLYQEAKKCFVNGTCRGAIMIMETALTALLFKNIDLEIIRDEYPKSSEMIENSRTGKMTIVNITNPRILIFNNLIKLAKKEKIISKNLSKELDIFRWIRHGVAHHELVIKSHLGSKLVSIRGEGKKVYGYSFETPFQYDKTVKNKNGKKKKEKVRELINLYSLFEGAKKGFEEFFNLFKELK